MPKKIFISWFLLFAFLLMGAHNFTPHHHHDEDTKEVHHSQDQGKHHQHEHHDGNQNQKSDSLSDLFSFFSHSGSTVEIIVPSHSIDLAKKSKVEKHFNYPVTAFLSFHKEATEVIPLYYHHSKVTYNFHQSSFNLRGPPVSIA